MRRFAQYAVMLFLPLLSGHTPGYRTVPTFQQELADLTRRGYTYRYLDNNLIELTEPATGTKHIKSLATTDEATIRAWAQQRGVPIIEIDPAQIDTNLYIGWFEYWREIPLGNLQHSVLFGDLDRNGSVDFYGIYKDFQSAYGSRIFEIDDIGNIIDAHDFPTFLGSVELTCNTGWDSLEEVGYIFSRWLFDYEQPSLDSLPIALKFQHDRFQGNLDPGYTRIFSGSLDDDGYTDFIYTGSELDSVDSTLDRTKTYVAEYDSMLNNLKRVWSTSFGYENNPGVGGFSVSDFDGDGKNEFVCSAGLLGKVFVVENNGDNAYEETWQDSIPYVNLYYHGNVDLDGDGLDEFFVGATLSSGNWTTVYEADGDNSYSPRVILHINAGGTFDDPNYVPSDLDGDGKSEMLIASGSGVFVFRWSTSGYYLWYYKDILSKTGVRSSFFFGDKKQSLVVSKVGLNGSEVRYLTEIYRPGPALSAYGRGDENRPEFWIEQNYPNPFNPATTFRYSVASTVKVYLEVYDLKGSQVAVLTEEIKSPGVYTTSWNGSGFASGIYFYTFRSGSFIQSGKMILLR